MPTKGSDRRRVPSWLRPLVDAAMTVVFLAQMVPGKTGNALHELLGIVFAALFLVHHVLNRGWLRRLGRGRTLRARLTVASDVVLMIAMLGTIASGVLMSRSAAPALSVPAVAHVVRPLHGTCAYLSLMAMSLHVGLHMRVLRSYAGLRGPSHSGKVAPLAVLAASFVLGTWAFVRLGVLAKLLGETSFPDGMTPLALQLAYHLALAAPFVALGSLVASRRTSDTSLADGREER